MDPEREAWLFLTLSDKRLKQVRRGENLLKPIQKMKTSVSSMVSQWSEDTQRTTENILSFSSLISGWFEVARRKGCEG